MPTKIFTKGENLWAQHSWSVLLSPFSWWLLLTIFSRIKRPDSFWTTLLSWLRFGAKVKSLAEIDRRPLSELSIDKSFTKKSQTWTLYTRIQIWSCFVRVLRLFVLRTIVTEMVDACIANYRHWHGQRSWRARFQIPGAVRFVPASSILSSHRPNISSHSVLVLAQY